MREGDMVRVNSLGPFLVLMFACCLKCFPVAWQHLETFLMLGKWPSNGSGKSWALGWVLRLTGCCG